MEKIMSPEIIEALEELRITDELGDPLMFERENYGTDKRNNTDYSLHV